MFYSSNCRVKFFRYVHYGCTPELYLDLYERQGGLCAVCRLSKPLVVDHCHVTRVVRGLLCNNCNTALGMLEDKPERILALLNYLQQ